MEWLEVTNFAINCRFLVVALTAVNSEDLKPRLSNDHFWGLATLYDDTRPALVRPGSVSEEVYRKHYWQIVHGTLPTLDTSLHVVRDIFLLSKTRFDPKTKSFSPRHKHVPQGLIAQAVFDYPDFEPFRYAYVIIKNSLAEIFTVRRTAEDGELCYSLEFKVIEEVAISHSISLSNYVVSQ